MTVKICPSYAVNVLQPTFAAAGPQGPSGAPGGADVRRTVQAGETIHGHRAVVEQDGLLFLADNASLGFSQVLGVSLGAGTIGSPVEVVTFGLITEPTWSWTAGQPIFLGPAGVLTDVPPTSDFLVWIGVALSATQLHVRIGSPVMLLAHGD